MAPSIVNRFVRADNKPIAGTGTAGEALSQYQVIYLNADGTWYKADNTIVRNTSQLAIAAYAAANGAEFVYICLGKWKAKIAGTVAVADKLTPSATAGSLVKGTTLAHTHNITIATAAYPSGVSLNYDAAGTAGVNRLECTAGGTDTTTSSTPGDRLVATALEAGTSGDNIDVWVEAI